MPNTVVTSTVNHVDVVFNDDSFFGTTEGRWRKDAIIEVLRHNGSNIEVRTSSGERFFCQTSNENNPACLTIDTVDGADPTNIADLYTKIRDPIA